MGKKKKKSLGPPPATSRPRSTAATTTSSISNEIAVTVVVLAILLVTTAFHPFHPFRPANQPLSPVRPFSVSPFPFSTEAVAALTIDDGDVGFASRVINEGKPVVLHNTEAVRWEAMKKWSVPYLVDALGPSSTIEPVYTIKGRDTVLLHRDLAGINSWPGATPSYETSRSLVSKFAQLISRNASLTGEWHYFSNNIKVFSNNQLEADVKPSTTFELDSSARKVLWVGSTGVKTAMHFDYYENFHVSVVGRKRFLLVPPSVLLSLPSYPRIHPNWRRMKIDMNELSESEIRVLEEANCLEVILNPGECLYIPPLWFHFVSNLGEVDGSPGITVNVWSDNVHEETIASIRSSYLTIPDKTPTPTRAAATYFYLTELLTSLHLSPPSYLERVYEKRFSHFGELPQVERKSRELQSICASELQLMATLSPNMKSQLQRLAQKASGHLKALGPSTEQFNFALLELVEVTAYKGVNNDVLLAGSFLKHCFVDM